MASVKGRALLGWMSREQAIKFLQEDCVFDHPLSDAEAEAIWKPYRDRVALLGPRAFAIPPSLGMTAKEAYHANRFIKFLNSVGPHPIIELRKVDLRELTVIQHHVVTDRTDAYGPKVDGDKWLAESLPIQRGNSRVKLQVRQQNFNTFAEIELPHGEFAFLPDAQGSFRVQELLRHVTAMLGTDRGFLTAGYHRSFAKVRTAPIAAVPVALVAVAQNTLVSPVAPIAAPGENTGTPAIDPFCPFGVTAAKFADFFTEGLFIDVDLRKKRYQLQMTSTWMAVNDPT